jgi:hypothetical protein
MFILEMDVWRLRAGVQTLETLCGDVERRNNDAENEGQKDVE